MSDRPNLLLRAVVRIGRWLTHIAPIAAFYGFRSYQSRRRIARSQRDIHHYR